MKVYSHYSIINNLYSMLLLGFVLNLIKTLAINTNHGTLTDKGMGINLADKAENGWSLDRKSVV